MAEAAMDSSPGRFYCHQCTEEITPKIPEYTCPKCNSGFIEEVTASGSSGTTSSDASPQSHQTQDAAAQFITMTAPQMWTQAMLGSAFGPMDVARGAPSRSQGGEGNSSSSSSTDTRPGPSGMTNVRLVHGAGRNPYMEGLINYFLSRLGGEAMQGIPLNMVHLHGNPADYAWGAGGLDTIITQLLNQLENAGPPPAEREKIESLPHVSITQEQAEKKLQCSVCFEEFVLGESVRCLPCEHHYHNDCIIPWLELHGTCPVCRKDLNGQDTSRTENEAPFPIPEDSNNAEPEPGPSASNSSVETDPSLD